MLMFADPALMSGGRERLLGIGQMIDSGSATSGCSGRRPGRRSRSNRCGQEAAVAFDQRAVIFHAAVALDGRHGQAAGKAHHARSTRT